MKFSLLASIFFLVLSVILSSCTLSLNARITPDTPASSSDGSSSLLLFKVGDGSVTSLSIAEGSTLVFVVSLNEAQKNDITMQVDVTGTDLSSVFSESFPISQVFTAGQTTKSISITTLHDVRYSGARNFNVTLSDSNHSTQTTFSLSVTDLESTPVLSFAAASQNISETAGTGSVTVNLSGPASASLSYPYTFVDGTALNSTHYVGTNGTLTFAAGETSKTINFNITDNLVYGGDVSFSIAFSSGPSHTVNIIDNELPMGTFNITGITSAGESMLDAYLSNSTTPTINWQASTNATSYDVTIYQNDGTTVQCATQNTTSTSLNMGGTCSLTLGQNYKASVVAKLNSSTQAASNNLYSFYVNNSPALGTSGNGPWYVMAGSSITVNAQWAASPAVGVATDAESDTITFTSLGAGSLGNTITNNSTSFLYTAGASSYGQDSITYTITDSKGGTLTGTIKINVMTAFTWTGKTDASWSTATNWCGSISADKKSCQGGASAPGASDTILFDNTCGSTFTCTPTTIANVSVAGVIIKSNGFTQGTGFTLTVGASNWTQTGGSFFGGNSTITLNGNLTVSGGTFTSTSGTLNATKNWSMSSGSFVANSGTIIFAGANFGNYTFSPGTDNYFNVTFGGSQNTHTFTGSLNVLGSLILNDTSSASGSLNSGSINAYGDVTANNYGKRGTTVVNIVGNINQTISSSTASSYIPNLAINSTGGNVILAANVVNTGNFNYTAGAIDASSLNSTLTLTGNTWATYTLNPGSAVNYNNVTFIGTGVVHNMIGSLNINGTLTLSDTDSSGKINSGNIYAYGNVTATNAGKRGTAVINIVGNTNQTISSNTTSSLIQNLNINSTGGIVSFGASVAAYANYSYTAGTIDATGSTLIFTGENYTTYSITPGSSVNYNNVSFLGMGIAITLTGSLNVYGTLTLSDTDPAGSINTGTMNAYGNVVATNKGKVGTAKTAIVGSANQSISSSTSTTAIPNLEINSSGGTVSFSSLVYNYGNFNYIAGNIDATTANSTLILTGNSYNTYFINPGSSNNYYNITFDGSCITYSITGTINILNALIINQGAYSGTLKNGNINVAGNFSSTNMGAAGTTTITMIGGAAASISQGSSASAIPVGFSINKTAGTTVTLASALYLTQASQSLNVTSGNIDMAGFGLTITSNLSLNGNTLTKNTGTLTVNGTVVGTGALYGGTINP